MSQVKRMSILPPVIKTIIILNLLIFGLDRLLLGGIAYGGNSLSDLLTAYGALWPIKINAGTLANLGAMTFWPHQLISYMFMHGSFWHVFMNMFMLWMFGAEMERLWGSAKFLVIYILSGIGAAILHLIVLYFTGEVVPTVGASGALMGILAAFAFTFPKRKLLIFPLFIPISARIFILIYMGIELFSGLTFTNSNIAHFAHIGGAISGYLLMKYAPNMKLYRTTQRIFKFKLLPDNSWNPDADSYDEYSSRINNNPNQYYTQTQKNWNAKVDKWPETPTQPRETQRKSYTIAGEEITQERINLILDKISAEGYNNLSENEKNILNELSKKI